MGAIALYARATPGHEQRVADTLAQLQAAAEAHPGRIVQATSLGAEDMVLTDLIARHCLPIAVATLDTGMLHAETLALIPRLEAHYGLHVERHAPVLEQVATLLADARVCVAPLDGSPRNLIQGCCPLKLLEAFAAGKAVVASAVPPVEALARHDVEAWLVPPDDPAALAAGLSRVLADAPLRARLGAAGRQLAEAHSWAASNAQVLAVYAELLAPARA